MRSAHLKVHRRSLGQFVVAFCGDEILFTAHPLEPHWRPFGGRGIVGWRFLRERRSGPHRQEENRADNHPADQSISGTFTMLVRYRLNDYLPFTFTARSGETWASIVLPIVHNRHPIRCRVSLLVHRQLGVYTERSNTAALTSN